LNQAGYGCISPLFNFFNLSFAFFILPLSQSKTATLYFFAKNMKKVKLLLLFCFVACLPSLCGQEKAEALKNLIHSFYETGHFSGNVIVAKEGKILYQEAIGLADREWDIEHDMEGKFIIGSLSKQFMGALAMILHQEGKLDLDAKVLSFFPLFPNPEIADKVTVHHLLSNTSGLPHYGAWEDFMEKYDRLPYSRSDLFEKFKGMELRFEPGTQHGYSSLGFLLLGFILEEAGGDELGNLLQEKIFQPSGMSHSSLDDHITILPKRVRAYRYNYQKARYDNANYRDPSTTFAAGGGLTTAGDLLKWDRILAGNRLLSEASRKKLFTPVRENYAYGWRTALPGRTDSLEVQWHAGQVTGYLSMLARLPKEGYCIILLSNIRDMAYLDITNQIINILHDQPVERPRRSLLKRLLEEIVEKNVEAAVSLYHRLRKNQRNAYTFSEVELLILGIELNSEGMHREALKMLELCLEEYPESGYLVNNWMLLGETHEVLGHRPQAIRCYEEVLKIDPDNEEAKRLLNR